MKTTQYSNNRVNLLNNSFQGLRPTLLALAIAQTLTLSTGAQAATIVVNTALDTSVTDNSCSLREAVSSMTLSNVAVTGCVNTGVAFGLNDQINFSVPSVSLNNGRVDITKSLIINGGNAGVTISGDGSDRLFLFNAPGTNSTLNNLMLSGGGGAKYGGAIYAVDGNLNLNHCTVSGNAATDAGGGISAGMAAVVNINNSTVSGNSAPSAGGLEAYAGAIINLNNSTVSGNTVSSYGGGIAASSGGTVVLKGSTLSGNTAEIGGGGISLSTGSLYIVNSTLSGNSATNGGGIVVNGAGTVQLLNATMSNNTASSNGGGVFMGTYAEEIFLYNSIIANSVGGDCQKINGAIITNNQSIIEDGSCGTPALNVDPLLGPLADNGGPTKTHALLRGSPAINAANNVICAAAPVNNLDQRGERRPTRGICDIGAYEFGAESTSFVIPLLNGKVISFDL